MSTRLSSLGAKRAKRQHAKCKKEEKSCTPSVFHQVQRSPAICLHVWLSLFKIKGPSSYFDFFTSLCKRDLNCQMIWQTDIVFSQACKCTCLQKVLDSAGVKEKTRTWVRTRAACQLSPRCLFPFSLHALPSSWNAWHLASLLAKLPLFKQRVFSLADSWQMACKFLSNTLSLSIPWIFGEINYHWVVTKMGRQKPKPEFFVFVKQAIYIPHICPHMKSFVSVSLCSPLPPFLYYCKRNRSFLRTFLTVKTILTFDIFAVVELFMLSLLPSLLHEVASYCHRTSLTSFLFLHISFQVTVFDLFFVFLSDQFVLPVFMFDFE